MRTPTTIARRDLLRGTAALVGGSALGLLPSLAEAALRGAPAAPLTLAFWNGRRFVAVDGPAKGDRHESVRLTVTSAHGGGFAALEAHAPCTGEGRHPFTLWVAPPAGLLRHRTRLVTEKDGSLVLGVHAKDGTRHETVLPDARREGTYVLVPAAKSLGALHLDAEGVVRGDAPHVRIDVARA